MNIAKVYDVFIAFHNSGEQNGSREQAQRLYECLEDRGIKCFMFSHKEESVYKANFMKIMQSRLFIFVCNKNIARNKNGELDFRKNYHLYVEMDTFFALTQSDKVPCSVNDATVVQFVEEDGRFSDTSLEKIHPLFDQRNSFFYVHDEEDMEEIVDWAEDRLEMQSDDDFSPELLYLSNQRKLDLQNFKVSGIDFRRVLRKAKVIKCLGISNWTFSLTDGCVKLKDALKRGVRCEMLFLDPEGENVKLRSVEENKDTVGQIHSSFDMIRAELKSHPRRGELLETYVYDLIPRDNLIFIYSEEGDFAFVQNYSHALPGSAAPQFVYERRENSPIFEYYEGVYSYVKNHSSTHKHEIFEV